MSSIVVGLGFGDEGKGLMTSYLVNQKPEATVVRFNGGHQAGHTVVHEGKRHVFSSFGSGTLQGADTYWSQFCTVHPTAFMNEYNVLKDMGINPKIICHPLCPVTTPYDVGYNREIEGVNNHGSVGVGFGATLQRQEDFYKLYVKDMYHPKVFQAKLQNIAAYYKARNNTFVAEDTLEKYMKHVEYMMQIIEVTDVTPNSSFDLVYEGAQGILLDMDHGFFPNVTRSNTTTKNARILHGDNIPSDVYYVTRCYQTRHGAGFMTNEGKVELINNQNETNVYSAYQGSFRIGELDYELMNYALECDESFSAWSAKHLLITCCDQRPDFKPETLLNNLKTSFKSVYVSYGPSHVDIVRIR